MDARRRLTQPGVVLPLALLAGQAGLLVLSPILVEVADDFEISTAAAGQLRTMTGLIAGVTALAFGRLGRGVPLRDLMLVGAGLLATGSLLGAAAPTFVVLAVAQVLIGLAVAVLISAGAAAAGEWTAPENRSRVLARTLMGLALTAFVSAARTYAGGAFGLAASEHRLAVMGIRAAANQFGYLIGAAAGGIALVVGGYRSSASSSARCWPRRPSSTGWCG